MALPMPRPPALICIVFACVIIESVGLKLYSYCHPSSGMGFARAQLRPLQLASAGLSRYKAIPYMYESLTGRPMPEAAAARALERFGEHDEASRDRMRLMDGAREFLEAALE